MTILCLAIAWLSGIYAASVVRVPGWLLWLAGALPLAVSLLWWRQWRIRLSASCALLLVLGALRYQTALPTFDQSTLAYYNGRGPVTVVGEVADEPDVRDRYVNLTLSARYLEVDGERHEVSGLALVRTARYPGHVYGDELRIEGGLETPPAYEDFSYK